MKCPRCQHETPADAEFCPECGAKLVVPCAQCGTPNGPGHKFCKKCGQPLTDVSVEDSERVRLRSPHSYTPRHLAEKILTSKSALEGERKQVTVLFADLKGSMELLADRDPEEARKILDPVLERMMEAVHRYEGTVNQVMGDGIMALFGAPLAHEDHAVRACYAALRMQESVKKYADEVRRSHAAVVKIRVGLNSGEVVVRAIGSDLHMDYTAVGQTTHLAARMEQIADPGAIVITPETLALAEGYIEVNSLGPVPVKGLTEAVDVYEVTGAGPARTRLQVAARRGLTRFVGRDAELGQLRRAQQLAGEGHGQVAALVGEAGVGKSRLVYEFTHSHRLQGWLVLESASVSYGKATSYLPVIDLLKGYFKIQDRDDLREIREKVTGKLLTLDRALEPTLPALLALLDVPVDDASWQTLDPGQRRQCTLDAVRRLLLREAREQPLLVIFEDLHWIDGETQALLDGLVDSLGSTRLLLLVNYRPEYQHAWGSKTAYSQMRLDALPAESAGELLEALLGDDPGLAPLKQLLVKRGNPFFLEETVRTLVETKALAGERGRYRLTQPVQAIQVPPTVQAMLAARIDRLPPADKRLLQVAAVIGKDVPFPLLQAIAELPDEALRRGLDHLQVAEFLHETGLYPDLEYAFTHALTHEVTYGGLLQDRRRALHAALVDAIERLFVDRLAEQMELLAHHAVRGGLGIKAAQYLRQAGVKAIARSAHREAVGCFEQALALLRELPETTDTLADALDTRIVLGPALIALRGAASSEVEASYLHARELVDRLGEGSRLFPVLWGLWYVNYSRGQYSAARRTGEQLLEAAQKRDDTGQLLEAHHALWPTLSAMGRPAEAFVHAERGFALYDCDRHASQALLYGNHDPGVCCRYHLALTGWLLGYADRSLNASHDALRLAEELKHPYTMANALWFTAVVHYERGDQETAATTADRALALAREHGFTQWVDVGLVLSHLRTEERPDAQTLAELHRRLVSWTGGATWRQVFCLCVVAELYAESGLVEEALGTLASIPGEHRGAFYAPEIHRIEGELLLQRSPPATDEAERRFCAAVDLARGRAEKSLELRAATSLARLWQRQGKRDDARRLLGDVYGWFTEGFDTADLRDAKMLLNELSSTSV